MKFDRDLFDLLIHQMSMQVVCQPVVILHLLTQEGWTPALTWPAP